MAEVHRHMRNCRKENGIRKVGNHCCKVVWMSLQTVRGVGIKMYAKMCFVLGSLKNALWFHLWDINLKCDYKLPYMVSHLPYPREGLLH